MANAKQQRKLKRRRRWLPHWSTLLLSLTLAVVLVCLIVPGTPAEYDIDFLVYQHGWPATHLYRCDINPAVVLPAEVSLEMILELDTIAEQDWKQFETQPFEQIGYDQVLSIREQPGWAVVENWSHDSKAAIWNYSALTWNVFVGILLLILIAGTWEYHFRMHGAIFKLSLKEFFLVALVFGIVAAYFGRAYQGQLDYEVLKRVMQGSSSVFTKTTAPKWMTRLVGQAPSRIFERPRVIVFDCRWANDEVTDVRDLMKLIGRVECDRYVLRHVSSEHIRNLNLLSGAKEITLQGYRGSPKDENGYVIRDLTIEVDLGFLESCPNLKRLEIIRGWGAAMEVNDSFAEDISRSAIEELKVGGVDLSQVDWGPRSFPNLKSIDFYGCKVPESEKQKLAELQLESMEVHEGDFE